MRDFLPANDAALYGTVIMPRDFLRLTVRNRTTGAPVEECLWSDIFDLTATVQDVDAGSNVSLTFQGAGGLVSIPSIPRAANLEVNTVEIQMLAFGVDIDRLVRTYDASHAKVEIWRGFLNTESRLMVAPAEPRFFGFVDEIDLPTGADEEEAMAVLRCVSHTQEASRSNADTRSDASQRRRSATDDFYADAATVGDWEIFWGTTKK